MTAALLCQDAAAMKRCCRCHEVKGRDEFGRSRSRGDGLNVRCRACCSIAGKAFYAVNSDKVRAQHRRNYHGNPHRRVYVKGRTKLYWGRIRRRVIDGYGGRCACCGETRFQFLTLDHVNKDGNVERRSLGVWAIYRRAEREGFPPDLQILCFNCNCARSITGDHCPHDDERAQAVSA